MDSSLRRSKREHQLSAKAAVSLSSTSAAVASSSSRRSQRRRVTRSASPASTPVSTRNSSPVRGVAASSDLVAVVVDAVGPNGQRRRVRAAAHTGANSSVTQGVHADGKVMGKYSSRDCALLCEVILGQLKKQTLSPTVLDKEKSPAFIRWGPVAKKMETTRKLRVTPRDCQVLWKFLAYGQMSTAVQTEELLSDSDEEDFHKTPKEINAQLAKTVYTTEGQVTAEQQSEESEEKDDAGQDKSGASETRPKSEPSVRLYPTYSLPTGAPDAWYRPFGPKDALPLTFVASRFLKRKANPPMQSMYTKATTGAISDLKRKQAVPAVTAVASKKPKLATPPVSTPPRVFTPSSTPPPAAKRARSELEFFEIRLREELAKKIPGSTFEMSAADIQRRFGEASAEIRRECQMLAARDLERFNREVVRGRIWAKAMGANSARPTPALAAASKPAPASQVSSVQPSSAASATAATTIPSKPLVPATTKSSGPTAALLAHAAAVAAVAAKTQSAVTAGTTGNASKTTQEEKAGGSSSNVSKTAQDEKDGGSSTASKTAPEEKHGGSTSSASKTASDEKVGGSSASAKSEAK